MRQSCCLLASAPVLQFSDKLPPGTAAVDWGTACGADEPPVSIGLPPSSSVTIRIRSPTPPPTPPITLPLAPRRSWTCEGSSCAPSLNSDMPVPPLQTDAIQGHGRDASRRKTPTHRGPARQLSGHHKARCVPRTESHDTCAVASHSGGVAKRELAAW